MRLTPLAFVLTACFGVRAAQGKDQMFIPALPVTLLKDIQACNDVWPFERKRGRTESKTAPKAVMLMPYEELVAKTCRMIPKGTKVSIHYRGSGDYLGFGMGWSKGPWNNNNLISEDPAAFGLR